jgi:hypothetical protein
VVIEVSAYLVLESGGRAVGGATAGGFALGLTVMYATALLV